MDLKNQKRMAAEILKCGHTRVWIDPNRIEDVADAITRADIRTAIESGTIRAKPEKGISRGRARYMAAQKAKGRRRGQGSRKGTAGARTPRKRRWIQTIRPIRVELAKLRDEGTDNQDSLQGVLHEGQGRHVQEQEQSPDAPEDRGIPEGG